MKKEIKFFIIVIIILSISVFFWMILTQDYFDNSTINNKKINETEININLAKWLTYVNDSFNYSIDYLDNWVLLDTDSANVQFYISQNSDWMRYDFTIFSEKNSLGISSEEWAENILREYSDIRFSSRESILVGGQECVILHETFAIERLDERIYCAYDDFVFSLIYPSKNNSETVYNPINNEEVVIKMLDTFKRSF